VPNRGTRVLLVAPSLAIVGGQSVQAAHLLAAFRDEPSVAIEFQPIDPPLPGFVRKLRFVRTAVNWVVFAAMLLGRVRRCDVVHTFAAAYWSYLLWPVTALGVARLYGKPIILNYRDGQAEDHLRHWRTAAPTMRWMNAVVSPSGFLVDVFARYGVPAQSIFNIIPMERFRFRPRRQLRPVFLHNRGLEPLYNVPCSLRAFQIVQARYPNASLTVAHDGPLRSELEGYAHKLGLRNTHFTGAVTQSGMADLYDAADIYLTSPEIDNMPGSLLECFASGLPVVATRVGGIPYIATDGEDALLVPPGDHEAMASAAIRLLEDPGLTERLTRNAYERCRQYSAESVRAEWTALYRKLVNA
jgi:glycosyltransferase involved in cell wall biosynthesis